jgi:hypothetical protein
MYSVCTLYSLYDLVSAAVQWFDAVYNADIEYIKKHPKNINKVGQNTSSVFLGELFVKNNTLQVLDPQKDKQYCTDMV